MLQDFIVYDPNKTAQIRFKNIEEAFAKLKLPKLELHELEELVGEDFWNEKANGILVERRVVQDLFKTTRKYRDPVMHVEGVWDNNKDNNRINA